MLENWGLMTKAQDDDTTIQQAIDASILAHESDPESHMGVGESIENHRTNEVLDHKAGAVLADKLTMSEFVFNTTFENLSSFVTVGLVDSVWPGATLDTQGTGTVKKSSLVVDMESGTINFDTSKKMQVQFSFYADGDSNSLCAFFLGRSSGDEYLHGMGLELVGETARFFTGWWYAGTPNYLSWPTFNFGNSYIVRIQNVPDEGVVKVYIDGELLGTLVWPEVWDENPVFKIFLSDSTGYGNSVRIYSLDIVLEK